MKRFLVTTANEACWHDKEPILFLGEWCRLYDRKFIWDKLDAIVVPYHWDDRGKLYKDYLYLEELYEELLSELSIKLNTLHNVNHSVRYWRILVGPWLGWFIQILFDRWTMLQKAFHENDISGVRVLYREDEFFAPNDMIDFTTQSISEDWNDAIYGQLLEYMNIPVEKVSVNTDAPVVLITTTRLTIKSKIKRTLIRAASNIVSYFCRNNEYFFISSYLPGIQDLLLQVKLGQIPKIWRLIQVPTISFNNSMRQWQAPEQVDVGDFSMVARAMIPVNMPKVYLEGYQKILSMGIQLPWPKQPKVIFTSNSYMSDDIFKVWAAEKVDNGTPLVVGQHGGNYGTALWNFFENHQINISDKFLTWGWGQKEHNKIIPVGIFKTFNKQKSFDKDGIALLVEAITPRSSYHMFSIPVAAQWLSYFDEQIAFVNALPENIRDMLIVRLRSLDYNWQQKQRWREHFPIIQLDDGTQPILSLVKKCRIYISTYNATTYLESMSLNIPTIIFWNPTYWELRESAIPYFEQLKKVGIFHETPESAALHMSSVWDNVSEWWESNEVQTVRKEFCDHYSRIPEQPLEVMAKLFRKIANT